MDTAHDDAGRFGRAGYDATTYGEAFADVYDLWYEDLGDDDFVAELCAMLPPRPGRILELGVGTGRLLDRLAAARMGIDDEMTGVDASPRMLALARARLGDAVALVQADFSEQLPDGTFDLVFVGYNTLFNLPDDDALESCMTLVARRLAPDGTFSLDTTCPSPGSGTDPTSVRLVRAGEEIESTSRHDPSAQRITGNFVHLSDGPEPRIRPWTVRYWHPHQLDAFARRAGLDLVAHRVVDTDDAVGFGDGRARRDSGAGGRTISHYRAATGNLLSQ